MIGQNFAPDLWTPTDFRYHPLAGWDLSWKFRGWGWNGWMKGFALYQCQNKEFTEAMKNAEKLEGKHVWYRRLVSVHRVNYEHVSVVFWMRRNSRHDIEEAIATMLMLHSNPVVLARAFEPK